MDLILMTNHFKSYIKNTTSTALQWDRHCNIEFTHPNGSLWKRRTFAVAILEDPGWSQQPFGWGVQAHFHSWPHCRKPKYSFRPRCNSSPRSWGGLYLAEGFVGREHLLGAKFAKVSCQAQWENSWSGAGLGEKKDWGRGVMKKHLPGSMVLNTCLVWCPSAKGSWLTIHCCLSLLKVQFLMTWVSWPARLATS